MSGAIRDAGCETRDNLVGKFVRLPSRRAFPPSVQWVKIVEQNSDRNARCWGVHIRVRARQGKPATWIELTPDMEVRDAKGVAL